TPGAYSCSLHGARPILSGLEPSSPSFAALLGLLTVLSWSVGTILYVGIAVLVILRIVHFGITPRQFEPTYWVAMWALAIAVVAEIGRAHVCTPVTFRSR